MCRAVVDVSFNKSLSSIGLGKDVMNVVFPCEMFIKLHEKPSYQKVKYVCVLTMIKRLTFAKDCEM